MPTWGSGTLRIPPGPPSVAVEQNRENFLIVQRVQVLRQTTAVSVASWVAGNPANPNPQQPGKYVIYSDVAGNPGTLIAQSIEVTITGLDPSGRCTLLTLTTQPVLAPGFYWVGSFTGTAAGAGEWIWRGAASGGNARRVAATYGAGTPPASFPGGATSLTYEWGIGINVAEQPQTKLTGAICGEFLCGQLLVGQIGIPFNKPFIDLVARSFAVFDAPPVVAAMGKPRLDMIPRAFVVSTQQSLAMNKAILLLQPIHTDATIVAVVTMGKPFLELRSRAFLPSLSTSPQLQKAILELLGREARGRIAGLIPTDEVDLILSPTDEQDGTLLLTPAVEEDLLLVPTTEAVG